MHPLSTYWTNVANGTDIEMERRERKGWKVKIHDLSGLAVGAAFITTPVMPSTGCDWVARSNPGVWLIIRPDPCRPECWEPWGRLEDWREHGGISDSFCCQFCLLQEGADFLFSEININTEKGRVFFIDSDQQMRTTAAAATPILSPRSGGDYAGLSPPVGVFLMSCRVHGEGKSSKPMVHLVMRHVTCVEDAAIFMALAAAVDLSIEACRPSRRKSSRVSSLSW